MHARSLTMLAISLATIACGDNRAPSIPDAKVPRPDAPGFADAAVDADAGVHFVETYGSDTQDVGYFFLTSVPSRPRILEPTGGDPDGFLYGEVSTPIPTWSTISTRYQPGLDDAFKRDSVFVGDYYDSQIGTISVDLDVIQPGSWTSDRTVTLHLMSWDTTSNAVAFDAFYSLADMADPPSGWNRYVFVVDARSPTIPAGWTLVHGDGSRATDADWATFMHQIDLVGFGFWKPGFGYPSFGTWQLGIDNVSIDTHP